MTYRKRRAADQRRAAEAKAPEGLPVEVQAAPGGWGAGAASVLGVLAAARHDGLPTKVKLTLESLRATIDKIESSPPRPEPFSRSSKHGILFHVGLLSSWDRYKVHTGLVLIWALASGVRRRSGAFST